MIEYIRFNSGYPVGLASVGKRKISFRERITVLYGAERDRKDYHSSGSC